MSDEQTRTYTIQRRLLGVFPVTEELTIKTYPLGAKAILEGYRLMKSTAPDKGISSNSQYGPHSARYDALRISCQMNPDAYYELFFSDLATDEEKFGLFEFATSGYSAAKQDNLPYIPFLKRLYDRADELPEDICLMLKWFNEVHGYFTGDESEDGV